MADITPLTPASFRDFIEQNEHVLIHFRAAWNGYDVEQRRIIESDIPEGLAACIAFGSFAVDPPEHHAICRELNIRNLLFLALYYCGTLFRTWTGVLNQKKMILLLR